MSRVFIDAWPFLARALALSAYVAAGAVGSGLFFGGLWWSARILVAGNGAQAAVALTLGRFLLIGGLLTIAAFEGAAPLLAASIGIFIGRRHVLRSIGTDGR